jgi:hypothetical protein
MSFVPILARFIGQCTARPSLYTVPKTTLVVPTAVYFYYPGLFDYQLARSCSAPQQVEPRGQASQRERQFFRVGGDKLVADFPT